ncbi:MAG: glycosyltransferase family 4 protein, partial [Janthinobacterium lividum]
MHEVGSRLAAQGHAVSILTADPTGTLPSKERIAGMDVVRVPSGPKGTDWCLAPGIYRHLMASATRPDVVHVQGYHTFSAPLAMLGAIRARIPFVLTFHSGGHSSAVRRAIRAPQSVMLAPLARRAARLVGVSRFEADHFSRAMRIPREQFVVVPNGAGLPAVQANASTDEPLIISLGRLERYKGHHRALEGFARLRGTLPSVRLRILETGPYEGE